MKVWKGETPKHTIALKIDGIQAMLNDKGEVVSRAGKPLHNIDPKLLQPGAKYEVFLGSFKETVSVLRTHDHKRKVLKHELFMLWPTTDKRIVLPFKPEKLDDYIKQAFALGAEGLVIDQALKIKRKETHDVPITGIIPGKGKHLGRMGALLTPHGKVGTGFSDKERELTWKIGDMIEVECMELTASGKFRKPRFIRHRWDKK